MHSVHEQMQIEERVFDVLGGSGEAVSKLTIEQVLGPKSRQYLRSGRRRLSNDRAPQARSSEAQGGGAREAGDGTLGPRTERSQGLEGRRRLLRAPRPSRALMYPKLTPGLRPLCGLRPGLCCLALSVLCLINRWTTSKATTHMNAVLELLRPLSLTRTPKGRHNFGTHGSLYLDSAVKEELGARVPSPSLRAQDARHPIF